MVRLDVMAGGYSVINLEDRVDLVDCSVMSLDRYSGRDVWSKL